MPTYEHICTNVECSHQWEDSYSIKMDPPKICPKCQQSTVQRLISLGGKGVVELSGQELVDKLKNDAKSIQRQARKDEKLYANLLGESKYQDLQVSLDRRKSR